MDLTQYTTTSDVRAVLGVNTQELPDALLLSPIYLTNITLALEDINLGIPALFATISAIAQGSRTPQQARFYDLVTLYAPYVTAKQLLVSLSMFGVEEVTDGRAAFNRQKDAYVPVAEGVGAMLSGIKLRLATSYATLEPGAIVSTSSPSFTTMLTASLSVDPVTNA